LQIGIDALTIRRPFTGVQRALTGLLTGFSRLIDSGDEAILPDDSFIILTGRKSPLPELSERFKILRTFFSSENRTLRIIYQHLRLNGRLFKAGADIMHAPAYTAPRFGFMPVVLTVHDMFVYDCPSLCRKSNVTHFKRFMPASIHIARRIIVPSKYTRERVIANFPESGPKIEIVPFGIEQRFFDKKVSSWPQDAIPLPKRFVLFVGALEPKKNLETLIKAFFAAVLHKKLDHHLVIAGPDSGSEKLLHRLVTFHGFEERVHFLGFVDDELLPALYRKADLFVFPSVAEGFGFPMLEAMASGVPVVASGIPALMELAPDCAYFATPGNVASFRENIETAISNSSETGIFTKKARLRAAEYTWERTARATMNIYRKARK